MGYRETDLIVGEDSFNSFEECLKIANDENVDFVLLGGDLFHE
jgi:double-strand break repair protein MRE11